MSPSLIVSQCWKLKLEQMVMNAGSFRFRGMSVFEVAALNPAGLATTRRDKGPSKASALGI